MIIFNNKEAEYLQWLKDNPDGFVINAPKQGTAVKDRLHRATCGSITTEKQTNYTTTAYMKICSEDKQGLLELLVWAKKSDNYDVCSLCKP